MNFSSSVAPHDDEGWRIISGERWRPLESRIDGSSARRGLAPCCRILNQAWRARGRLDPRTLILWEFPITQSRA